MKTVNQMTVKEIIESIEVMRNGLSLNPGEREKQILTKNIERAQTELKKREDQKKSEQPSANQGQLEQPERTLPTKEELQAWDLGMEKSDEQLEEEWRNLPKEEKARQHREFIADMDKRHRVIGTVATAPVITIPVVEIALSSGTKQMNRAEIMTMLKTWFKRVATSKAMEDGRFSDAYGGSMGQDTWKLFNGWRMIYNETKEGTEYPPMLDCFPGYKNAKTMHKVNAEILWRWASNDK